MNSQLIDINMNDLAQDEIDRLEGHVHRRVGGRLQDFQLRVEATGLILQGRSATYYAKQLAQHAIMEATRLPIVANEIEVT